MMMVPEGAILDIAPSEAKKEMGISGKRKEVKIATVKAITDKFQFLSTIDDNTADAICVGLSAYRKLTT